MPIVVFYYINQPAIALGVGVGTLLIALTDGPSNRAQRINGAILSLIIFGITATLISLAIPNVWLTAVIFFSITFIFSMLAVFGTRYFLTGAIGISLAIFMIGLHPAHPVTFSIYVFFGGLWYYLLSTAQSFIWPYKSLKQAMAECLDATSLLVFEKVKCYDARYDLDECYNQTILQHIRVSEKQEQMRNLLLSDASILKAGNAAQQRLFDAGIQLIDMYEQVMAIHYDYAAVRVALEGTGALENIQQLITLQANALKRLSAMAFPQKKRRQINNITAGEFNQLRSKLITTQQLQSPKNSELIARIIDNLDAIQGQLEWFWAGEQSVAITPSSENALAAYSSFLELPKFKWRAIVEHISINDPACRFALRMGVMCVFAYLLGVVFPLGRYSYWIPLTVVIVARPRLGLTWQRNKQRLLGTGMGVIIGLAILLLVKNVAALLIMACVFLFGFYLLGRLVYAWSVFFVTLAVLISLSVYSERWENMIIERIYDTLIGCAIVFPAAFLFPLWETKQLKARLADAIDKNDRYLQTVISLCFAGPMNEAMLRLARKNAYTSLAAFSAALSSTRIEPHFKKVDVKGLRQTQILIYRINALTSSFATRSNTPAPTELDFLNKASELLANTQKALDNTHLSRLDHAAYQTNNVPLLHSTEAELLQHLAVQLNVFLRN